MMFQSLERLRRLLSRPSHTYRPTIETFPELDVNRLAQDLQLTKRGRTRGKANQPPTDSTSLDAVESEIVEQVGAARKRSHDALENHLAGFRQRLVDLDFEAQFSNIKSAALGGLSDLKQELQTGLDDLHGLRKDLKEAEDWQSAFRRNHQLDRPAKINTSRSNFFKWALILIIVIAELFTNGELLSKGSELGLVGGIIEAFIFSILNVGVALLFGIFAIPYVSHRRFSLKVFGLVSVAVYLCLMIVLNLSLAHYREVSGTLIEGAGQVVMYRLRNATFDLTDFRSWLLFGLGVLFSVIALIDGLFLHDVYPGYGRVNKALRSARRKYADMRRASIEELGSVRKEYEDLLATARADLAKQRVEHDAIVSHRQRMVGLFDEHQGQLEKAANVLLRTYRDANIEERAQPPPSRFTEPYVLSRIAITISREGEWNSSDLRNEILQAQAEVDKIFIALGQEFDLALTKYRELDAIAPDKP